MNESTYQPASFRIAVTGGQGVGKTTFCEWLRDSLGRRLGREIPVMSNLKGYMRSLNIDFGSASTSMTIPAVFAAHLERDLDTLSKVAILDRCVIDALAYTRILNISSPPERALFEALSRVAAQRLEYVIHLRLAPFFSETGKEHETTELRRAVAEEIPRVAHDLGIKMLTLDASSPHAIEEACTDLERGLRS